MCWCFLTTKLPQEGVKDAMAEFSKRLSKKEFLKEYIEALDDAKTLQQKDRYCSCFKLFFFFLLLFLTINGYFALGDKSM